MGILAAISVPKKLLLAALMLCFAVAILAMSLQSTNAGHSSFTTPTTAQQPMSKLVLREMVPGNPLYTLNMARDRIMLELTVDPVRNAWLRVEYANRRMETAKVLIDHGEVMEAINTMAKAEIYVGKAAELLNTHAPDQLAQLKHVLLDHRKQLEAGKVHLNNSDTARIDQLINYNASLIQTISQH